MSERVFVPSQGDKKCRTELPNNSSVVSVLNDSSLWKSERELLGDCAQCEIRAILRKLNTQIRDGRLRREVRAGVAYYAPVLNGRAQR